MLHAAFPCGDRSAVLPEQRVGLGSPHPEQGPIPPEVPASELFLQMQKLKAKLSGGNADATESLPPRMLSDIKGVSATAGFVADAREIRIDRPDRLSGFSETLELRMMPVSARFALKDLFGQQRLPPESNKPRGIKVFWMKTPEAHGRPGNGNEKHVGLQGRSRAPSPDDPSACSTYQGKGKNQEEKL